MRRWAFIHKNGCKKPAFLLRDRPIHMELLRLSDACSLDGQPIKAKPGDPILCESCGQEVRAGLFLPTAWIEEVDGPPIP